ncbi:hypothetical protein BU16DRAFT_598654, partial [Lophium mytilinum]
QGPRIGTSTKTVHPHFNFQRKCKESLQVQLLVAMKPMILFSLSLLPLAFAATTTQCECAWVKCGGTAAQICQCQNSAQISCASKCGGTPTLLPCPMDPPASSASPTSTTPEWLPEPTQTCECEAYMCIQSWPESCICENEAKVECYHKCGGPAPELQTCSGLTYAKCGGGRASYQTCADGYICIDDPYSTGCGLACDQYGICVENKMCGGFTGENCPHVGQICVDNPDDGCDPKKGGADCGGLCAG